MALIGHKVKGCFATIHPATGKPIYEHIYAKVSDPSYRICIVNLDPESYPLENYTFIYRAYAFPGRAHRFIKSGRDQMFFDDPMR